MLLLGMIGFALHATAITPLTASTANQQIEEQNQVLAEDLLEASAANGSLQDALLHYDTTDERFVGATIQHDGAHTTGGPPNEFGQTLNGTFKDASIAFNVYIEYPDDTGRWHREPMVDQGTPSDQAVTASKTVVLYDDMVITDPDNDMTLGKVEAASAHEFHSASTSGGGPVYNVVRVTIVVWKM
jgi:hypothetical protein